MARTGRRARALASLLAEAGATIGDRRCPLPTARDIAAAGLGAGILPSYRRLGGQLDEPRIRPGDWDLVVDGVAVELDEELHFNRYRRITLDAPFYDELPLDRTLYRRLCADHEAECLAAGSWGRRWTQPRAEVDFGAVGLPGDLAGDGAPRWKISGRPTTW